jgi:hypothetical protein
MRISFYLFLSYLYLSCGVQKLNKPYYELTNDEGILVEKFDSLELAKNKFTLDNKIFRYGTIFTFDYHFINLKKDEKFKIICDDLTSFKKNEKDFDWYLTESSSKSENMVNKIKMVVDPNFDHILYSMPGFNQSIITYYYLNNNGEELLYESTGVIENRGNIWLHPPRQKLFRILELNPFPFIKTPFKIGNKWEWSNKLGDNWADARWKTWQGDIVNTSYYKIVTKKEINTHLGILECFVIESISTNKLGNSQLTTYFNEEKGFVKLEYTNIDSTKIVFELLEINKFE